MAKTVGNQSGSVTCNNNAVTTLYTSPSSGVTKIIMCDWTLVRTDGSFMTNNSGGYAIMQVRKATPSGYNSNGNVVLWAPAPAGQSSLYRYAVYGDPGQNWHPAFDAANSQTLHYGGVPMWTSTSSNWHSNVVQRLANDPSYRSWATTIFYMAPSSQLNVYHNTGSSSTTCHYSFITINET